MALELFPLNSVIILLLIAAYFSAIETAIFSLSKFQLRQLKQKSPFNFERVQFFLDRPAAFVATVLLGNEVANVLISSLLASFYENLRLSPAIVTLVNLLTVMPLIMIFGEITPKVIAAKANTTILQYFLSPLWWFFRFSFPIRFLLESFVNLITRPLKKVDRSHNDEIKEEDIKILLEDGKRKGAIHSLEQSIIEGIFDIDDDHVGELATPLPDCLTVRQDESPRSVIQKINHDFSSRIPVWDESRQKIVGILYAKDLLKFIDRDEQELQVRDLMKEPLFVTSKMKTEVLFRRFRQMKRHIAIVEDSKGNSVAAVTMEDILEQMFGELWKEQR